MNLKRSQTPVKSAGNASMRSIAQSLS